jgi:hypothetical protein
VAAPRKHADAPWDEITALWEAGRSPAWIASEYAVPEGTIRSRMRRAGIPRGQPSGTERALSPIDSGGDTTSDTVPLTQSVGQQVPRDSRGPNGGESDQGGGVHSLPTEGALSAAERANRRLLKAHQRRSDKLAREIDRLVRAGPDAWGGRSAAAGLAALAQAHARLVDVDRRTAGLDQGAADVRVGVIVAAPRSDSPDSWAAAAQAQAGEAAKAVAEATDSRSGPVPGAQPAQPAQDPGPSAPVPTVPSPVRPGEATARAQRIEAEAARSGRSGPVPDPRGPDDSARGEGDG